MSNCDVPDTSWQARLFQGVVEYNRVAPPTRQQSYLSLTGLDGGDFTLGRAGGHRSIAVDGGDFSNPAWQWPQSPLRADGGSFS